MNKLICDFCQQSQFGQLTRLPSEKLICDTCMDIECCQLDDELEPQMFPTDDAFLAYASLESFIELIEYEISSSYRCLLKELNSVTRLKLHSDERHEGDASPSEINSSRKHKIKVNFSQLIMPPRKMAKFKENVAFSSRALLKRACLQSMSLIELDSKRLRLT